MARLLRPTQRARLFLFPLSSSSSSSFARLPRSRTLDDIPPHSQPNPFFPCPCSRPMSSVAETRISALHNHLLRLLRSEIDYESRSGPPGEAMVEFDGFTVEDRPGQQWVRMSKRHGEKEDVKVEATMFDGFVSTASPGAKSNDSDEYGKLHISLVVEISKGEGFNGVLQFVCSAWSDSLVVKKVSVLPRDPIPSHPFIGPNFKELHDGVRDAVMDYLAERGIDDELAAFLHDYMSNKDRIELLQWMGNIKSYIEK